MHLSHSVVVDLKEDGRHAEENILILHALIYSY